MCVSNSSISVEIWILRPKTAKNELNCPYLSLHKSRELLSKSLSTLVMCCDDCYSDHCRVVFGISLHLRTR